MRLFAHGGSIYEETKDKKWRQYTGSRCVWNYIRGKGASNASTVPRATEGTSFVTCKLRPSAVRLWLDIPSDEVRVYLWDDRPVRVTTARPPRGNLKESGAQDPKDARMNHFHTLVASMLYGRDLDPRFRVGAFVESVCERMADLIQTGEARKIAKVLRFDIHTLEGRVRVRGASVTEPRSVVDVLLDAHAATLKANRPEGWKERKEDARKTEFELRAYAAIAEDIEAESEEVNAKYTAYLTNLVTARPHPPPPPPVSRVDLTQPLMIDSLCVMHALYATNDDGKLKLEYLNDGTENFVFGIKQPHAKHGYDKAALVLRVRKNARGTDQPKDEDVKSERRIAHSLRGQGVVPHADETTVIVRATGTPNHDATVMRMFNSGSLDSPIQDASVSLNGVGDALVELYARLSTVARCVDTKEGNVVLNVERNSGGLARRTIALIDTDGHRCSFVSEKGEKAKVLRYIGPLDVQDLDLMLTVAREDAEGTLLDDPLLFAAVCLLVLHVDTAMRKKHTYPHTRTVLINHFDLIWRLVMRYDQTRELEETQTAQRVLAHYSLRRDLRGDDLRAHVLAELKRPPQKVTAGNKPRQDSAEKGAHYHAYWCGPDRLIADDDETLVREIPMWSAERRDKITRQIRKAAETFLKEYGKAKGPLNERLNERRLATHAALTEHRFYHEVTQEERERPLLPHSSPKMSERRAAMVRFRVDRITATALVQVMQLERRERAHAGQSTGPSTGPSGAEPEQKESAAAASALYTEDPEGGAEACARAMAAVLLGS